MKSAQSQQSRTGFLFITPMILCIVSVLIYPFCNSVVISFTNKMFTYAKYNFIGLNNYVKLFQDDLFWISLLHSVKFTVFGVLGVLVIGLLLALLLNKNTKYMGFFRGLLFLPWTLPSIVVALTFRWFYNDFYGYLNYILLKSHIINAPFNVLAYGKTAWIGVLIPLIWCYYPFVMVFLLAALQSIDKTLYQVAELDGATKWKMFWYITFPSLKPSIIVVTILEAIWMFCSFDLVLLLTNGGPANETMTLSLYIYRMAFPAKNMAYGATLSVIMFIFLILFTILYFRVMGASKPMKPKNTFWITVLHFVVLCVVTFVIIFPLVITFFTSLKPPGEVITATPRLLPHNFTLDNYIKLFKIRAFPRYMFNSFIVASCTSILSLMISTLGACAIVWIKFPGRKLVVKSILVAYMFPQILLIIPLFTVCYWLNLIDTKFSLILTYLSFLLPFSIWTLKTFFESIPRELLEAALMDGCSYLQALIKIILPVSLSGIATVVIFSFVLGWSEYLFATNLITTEANRTIAVGLQTLLGYYRTDYALLTAASITMSLPVLVFFVIVQKHFIRGLTIGAVKE